MEFDTNKPKDWLKLFFLWMIMGAGFSVGIFAIATIFKFIF